ncbi:MAG TPA: DUF1385 domain-containing protein [Blastocatellia bacterium]|nr:DUF1385 domain-containing protein [Blastocatellia bacterium]
MSERDTTGGDIIVGGQAVLEGVMMRSPNAYAVAVRRADGQIVSRRSRVPRLSDKYPVLKLPIVRGGATLIQSMVLGIKALNYSSGIMLAEEEARDEVAVASAATAEGPAGAPVAVSVARTEPEATSTSAAVGPMIFAIVANVALFILLPLLLTNALFIGLGAGWSGTFGSLFHSVRPSVGFNLVEGAIRVVMFVGLIYAMSRLKDMHRVFMYHGAEHKVVMAYEAGGPLTVEAARPQPRRHPRCGTSFLMVVMIVAIVLFSVVRFDSLALNAAARIALMPLVAGLSFEVIRAAAKKQSGWLFRAMVLPGLWLQGITTQEPSDDQLEVAIFALEQSLELEPS